MQFGSEGGAVIVVPNVARLSIENSKDIGIMTAAPSRVMDKDRF